MFHPTTRKEIAFYLNVNLMVRSICAYIAAKISALISSYISITIKKIKKVTLMPCFIYRYIFMKPKLFNHLNQLPLT